mmetsp:Transcript_19325/g.46690  ORF Transcript_19325/g.46690 Transcript_19325/m.46690 type:complete len:169 (-) Transcript_19325:33-539(-)
MSTLPECDAAAMELSCWCCWCWWVCATVGTRTGQVALGTYVSGASVMASRDVEGEGEVWGWSTSMCAVLVLVGGAMDAAGGNAIILPPLLLTPTLLGEGAHQPNAKPAPLPAAWDALEGIRLPVICITRGGELPPRGLTYPFRPRSVRRDEHLSREVKDEPRGRLERF